ncbi:hypothetical protein NBG4_250032 [Candidatus Sulfobium mesophilum]|uniref:Uncharacterized protein n=1 Tax=Candidatus Sulfobium mesophilum TaxID=2016548 RepID=A0A2U3QGN3_9BACT|nr:hypothetical protein NBG4_250032 [Candidatus Sulfobium mesophilum]
MMVTEEERNNVLTVSQVHEVGLLLGKVWALTRVLNQASKIEHGHINNHTVRAATTDVMKSVEQIKAILGV